MKSLRTYEGLYVKRYQELLEVSKVFRPANGRSCLENLGTSMILSLMFSLYFLVILVASSLIVGNQPFNCSTFVWKS